MNTTPTFETSLDRLVFKAIRRHTPKAPQTLAGIVASVDASGRLVLSLDELSGGLQRLIAAGHVAETEKHRFYDATCEEHGGGQPRTFSGITEAEHEAAFAEYRAAVSQLVREWDDEDEDGFAEQKLVLRWATPGGRSYTDEDEDAAEQLADTMEPIIAESVRGEINGFELGTSYINILIFGRASDDDVDEIYELLAPAFRTYGCPPGSSITRCYPDERGEVESDVVPDATA